MSAEKGSGTEPEVRREKVLVRGRELDKWAVPATTPFRIFFLPTEHLLSTYCELDTMPGATRSSGRTKGCAVQGESRARHKALCAGRPYTRLFPPTRSRGSTRVIELPMVTQ